LASRKEQREQARAEREAREAADRAKAQRNRRMLQLGGALAAAAVIVVVAIVISSGGSDKKSGGSPEGTAAGATQAEQLLNGIPQKGTTLGSPKAPVTVEEFADLQCPFCRDYTVGTFPKLVATYVKPGKVKMVFQNYAFIGPDSLTAARAAEAAAKQNKLWHFIDVFYNNQGSENTDYVTDDFLKKIADGAGVDVKKMLADRQDPKVDQAIAKAQQSAQQAGVNSTPTFLIKKAGSPPQKVSAAELESALAKAVGAGT
jgi:protein-disulfide isomerase